MHAHPSHTFAIQIMAVEVYCTKLMIIKSILASLMKNCHDLFEPKNTFFENIFSVLMDATNGRKIETEIL